MNKALNYLKKIKDRFGEQILESSWCGDSKGYTHTITVNDLCDEIETTLKEKEQQDSLLKILKEVIAFAQMLPRIEPNKDNGFDMMSAIRINIQRDIENKERELLRKWVLDTCFPKELKALEIIKNHFNKIGGVKGNPDEENVYIISLFNLTQEEYDLLKEVLE